MLNAESLANAAYAESCVSSHSLVYELRSLTLHSFFLESVLRIFPHPFNASSEFLKCGCDEHPVISNTTMVNMAANINGHFAFCLFILCFIRLSIMVLLPQK